MGVFRLFFCKLSTAICIGGGISNLTEECNVYLNMGGGQRMTPIMGH